MVSDVKESKKLRYLDTGERLDQREKIQATAARVGLTVPQVSHHLSLAPFCLFTNVPLNLVSGRKSQ